MINEILIVFTVIVFGLIIGILKQIASKKREKNDIADSVKQVVGFCNIESEHYDFIKEKVEIWFQEFANAIEVSFYKIQLLPNKGFCYAGENEKNDVEAYTAFLKSTEFENTKEIINEG